MRRTRRREPSAERRRQSVWAATSRYLPALLARGRHHARAVVRVDGAGGGRSASLIASGRVYGPRPLRDRADGVGRADPRHAASSAAVRALFRPRRRWSSSRRSWRRCSDSARTTPRTRARSTGRAAGRSARGSSTRRGRSASATWQTLRLVRGPQAFRLALAPMTNDFVALLKDSSLVSVITVVELTKQTSIFAANIGSWLRAGRAVRRDVSGAVAAAGAAGAAHREGMAATDRRPGRRPLDVARGRARFVARRVVCRRARRAWWR